MQDRVRNLLPLRITWTMPTLSEDWAKKMMLYPPGSGNTFSGKWQNTVMVLLSQALKIAFIIWLTCLFLSPRFQFTLLSLGCIRQFFRKNTQNRACGNYTLKEKYKFFYRAEIQTLL